jgi:hypothetical protein
MNPLLPSFLRTAASARLFLAIAMVFPATLVAQNLQQVQEELALIKAKLELADAKLALAQREAELAKLAGGQPGPNPAPAPAGGQASTAPSLVAIAAAEPRPRSTAPATTITTTVASTAPTAPTPGVVPIARAPEVELREAGLEKLNGLLMLERDSLLGANGVPADTFTAYIQGRANADLNKTAETLAEKRKENASAAEKRKMEADAEAKPGVDPWKAKAGTDLENLETLLVSIGYKLEKKRAAAAGTNPDDAKTKAALSGGRKAVVEIPTKAIGDVALRNAGISFSQGLGVVFTPASQGSDASIGTMIGRWNWLQRSAAGKWNRWVGDNNGEGDAQVPYRGKIEYWLGWKDYTDAKPATRRSRTWPELTAFGPFIGTGIIGDKVKFGAKEERPWLVGLSGGWGFYKDAASLLYIDAGITVSPSSGIDHSKFFAGASLDGIVLGQILGFTRKAHLPTETDK